MGGISRREPAAALPSLAAYKEIFLIKQGQLLQAVPPHRAGELDEDKWMTASIGPGTRIHRRPANTNS